MYVFHFSLENPYCKQQKQFCFLLKQKTTTLENENIERKCKNTKPKQKRINLTRGNKSVQALGQRGRGKKMMLRDIKFKWVYFLLIVVVCLPCSIHIMFY